MRLTVVWIERAEERLAEVWLASPDRNAVTKAVDLIDRKLTMDAHQAGDLRFDTVRSLFVHHLASSLKSTNWSFSFGSLMSGMPIFCT
jgi:hypothetical protein